MPFSCHSYDIHMSILCTRMSQVLCHSYALVCHLYILLSNGMPLVFIRMSSLCHSYVLMCHSYVLLCHPYVTRMWFYHEPELIASIPSRSTKRKMQSSTSYHGCLKFRLGFADLLLGRLQEFVALWMICSFLFLFLTWNHVLRVFPLTFASGPQNRIRRKITW